MDESIIIVPVLFLSIVWIVKIVSENKTRQKLIDKGVVDEKIKDLFANQAELSVLANLKWGMILIGLGLAFFVYQFLDYRWHSEGILGLMFILSGAGFLIYYPIAQNRLREIERRRGQRDISA